MTQVTSLTNVKQVVANNYNSTVVLTNDNKVYGVGQNKYGELGLGHTNQVNNWTEITSLRGTIALQNKYVQMLNGYYFNKNNIDYIYENDAQVILNTLQNKKDRKQKIGVISNSYSTKEGTEDLSIKKIVYESVD